MQLQMKHASVTSKTSLVTTTSKLITPVQASSSRSVRSPKRTVPATSQRRTSRTRAAAPKTEEGKETAKQVDAKLEEVFDKIEGAEDDIAAGNLEQKTAMEERQKDPRYADAKDALDLNKKDLEPTSGQEKGPK